jgi:hypothetical protein
MTAEEMRIAIKKFTKHDCHFNFLTRCKCCWGCEQIKECKEARTEKLYNKCADVEINNDGYGAPILLIIAQKSYFLEKILTSMNERLQKLEEEGK